MLTSFSSAFTPTLGFMEGVGVDKDNSSDAKEFEADFYTGELEPDFGGKDPYTVHTVIHGPTDWIFNGVGVLVSDTVKDGLRTMEWNTDQPVRFFNVVGGRWEVKKGEGTALYYYKGHPWNIDEMMESLNASRKYYSEWFHPYPWKELKVSEFPGLSSYAQGFPTNITFSESIGFLAKSDPKSNIAFMVTAHESAHQWWGNLLTPGKGPSGAFMSEAMAHFSTAMLFDQVKGQQQRAEFMRRIEDRYNDRRQPDPEKPILEVDGTRDGDSTVIYDKGGWAFWMLMRHMGRGEMLTGTRAFIEQYKNGPDYPVVHDYLAALRPHAKDPVAFDAFVKQWFETVVVPEFKIEEPKKEKTATGWRVTFKVKNVGNADVRVDVAASREERWKDDPKDKLAPAAANPDYKEQRVTISLSASGGAAAERVVVLDCPFEPTDIVVDPDVQLLMLDRRHAAKKL